MCSLIINSIYQLNYQILNVTLNFHFIAVRLNISRSNLFELCPLYLEEELLVLNHLLTLVCCWNWRTDLMLQLDQWWTSVLSSPLCLTAAMFGKYCDICIHDSFKVCLLIAGNIFIYFLNHHLGTTSLATVNLEQLCGAVQWRGLSRSLLLFSRL